MKLEQSSLQAPPGLRELLDDLGDGENGIGGTPVHRGEATLEDYLERCRDMRDEAKRPSHLVPETVFWALDSNGIAVGMVKMRHRLNEKLHIQGGHISYFVRRDRRGRGYGKEALRLALLELKKTGEKRALITTDLDNKPSIKIIKANGGRLEDTDTDPDTGKEYCRYWIDL